MTKPLKKKERLHTREVKAWAVLLTTPEGRIHNIQAADYFSDAGCDCCAGETRAMAIFETKKEATMKVEDCLNPSAQIILPCTISYSLPKKTKK